MESSSTPDLRQYGTTVKRDNSVQSQAILYGDVWHIPINLILEDTERTIRECQNFQPKMNVLIPKVDQLQQRQYQAPPVKAKPEPLLFPSQQLQPQANYYQPYNPSPPQQPSFGVQPLNLNVYAQETDRFKWLPEPSYAFALVVTLQGISIVKPRQLFTNFPQKYKLNTAALGSHLQKYKLKIVKQYKLNDFQDIQNWMVPLEFNSGVVAFIATKWQEPGFTGYQDGQIEKIIRDNCG
ncbi:Conserved_hypothetical protein [Hexamita inflata]|uniref:Uncharacterized protein n=1 Tax=Hexamita inflata TaxID=28002 RepID=A0ABP1GHD4_9EUKA